MSAKEMRATRRKVQMDAKMKAMIREVCVYVTFLLLLILVVNTNQDDRTFYQNADLANRFTSNITKVTLISLPTIITTYTFITQLTSQQIPKHTDANLW